MANPMWSCRTTTTRACERTVRSRRRADHREAHPRRRAQGLAVVLRMPVAGGLRDRQRHEVKMCACQNSSPIAFALDGYPIRGLTRRSRSATITTRRRSFDLANSGGFLARHRPHTLNNQFSVLSCTGKSPFRNNLSAASFTRSMPSSVTSTRFCAKAMLAIIRSGSSIPSSRPVTLSQRSSGRFSLLACGRPGLGVEFIRHSSARTLEYGLMQLSSKGS